ncbi:Angiotensin-converting enzyme [Meloidogyne graminicola]|uniref:Angiotensin-converting enzyme n=1 Tax=Meloidogyne graminicola TaxID=189291 RepID=A0A8S9ZLN4_9BILA|nr:Angiotensin-converting enzyme [Meloidogyne graminicola]
MNISLIFLLLTKLLFLTYFSIFIRANDEANKQSKIFIDDVVSEEDYGAALEQESSKPDDVDNDVIQSLVDNFLNKGTISNEGEKQVNNNEKLNKEAQALINSSDYWRVENLKPFNSITDPDLSRKWLEGYSIELQKVLHQIALAGWNYFTAASISLKQNLDEAEDVGRAFLKATALQALQFNSTIFPYGSLERIQFSVLSQQGMNALNTEDFNEYNKILLSINQQFIHTQLCGEPGKAPMGGDKTACLLRFSDIPSVLNTPGADALQCLDLWQKWRLAIGTNLKTSYSQLVQMSNKGAKLNSFQNLGEMWRAVYESPENYGFYPERQLDLEEQLNNIYDQIKPFYQQLHAYFRARLAALHSKKGGEENQKAGFISKNGPIPIHLLKSSNGDNWLAYYEQTKPFSDEILDEERISNELLNSFHSQNYTVRLMYSKEFIQSHRLMVKLYYQYSSRHQPILLRDAPNPSLSSALAGAFSVVARNLDYLRSLKLLNDGIERSESAEINKLYKEAIEEFVKLPMAIVADKWRYAVFNESITSSNWSEEWWKLRQIYQGIMAPSMADPIAIENDPIASPIITQLHAPATRDTIAYIAQFQILKKLCKNKLSQGCLPEKESMKDVHDAIKNGGSVFWLDSFEKMTGTRTLNASPLLEYYSPLIEWLNNINMNEQRFVGWEMDRGKEEPFNENELPNLQNLYENDNGGEFGRVDGAIGGDAQIAFPGQSCDKDQECLLDSKCNGTVCVCREGLYTLRIAGTYNCVPSDPAKVGFTDDSGGLVIALNPNNESRTPEKGQNAEIEAVVNIEHMDEEIEKNKRISNSAQKISWNLFIIALIIFIVKKQLFVQRL